MAKFMLQDVLAGFLGEMFEISPTNMYSRLNVLFNIFLNFFHEQNLKKWLTLTHTEQDDRMIKSGTDSAWKSVQYIYIAQRKTER